MPIQLERNTKYYLKIPADLIFQSSGSISSSASAGKYTFDTNQLREFFAKRPDGKIIYLKQGLHLKVDVIGDLIHRLNVVHTDRSMIVGTFGINEILNLEHFPTTSPLDKLDKNKEVKLASKVHFKSVIIEKEKVEQIKEAISQRENASLIFNDWGFGEIFEKGTAVSLLFYGIPGTGKTLMAQAIADHLSMKLEVIGSGDIQTSEPGGAERKMKSIFKKAGKETVILLDECDSLLTDRNSVGHIMASQINTLLSEIEKFEGVVIFTTNRLGKPDQAVERRISAKIEFSFPDKEHRIKIWKRMIPVKAPVAKNVDFDTLADYPLTGGSIKNATLSAVRKAAYRKFKTITHKCFVDAVEQELQSVQEFAAQKQEPFKQGKYIASRQQDIVEGNFGENVVAVRDFIKKREIKEEKK